MTDLAELQTFVAVAETGSFAAAARRIGVTPATAPFTDLPKENDQSLLVDGGMRVADGLWAAGDIATFTLNGQPQRIEHWRLAQQQARIAAANE